MGEKQAQPRSLLVHGAVVCSMRGCLRIEERIT